MLNLQMESSSSPIDRVTRNYDSLYGTASILIVASFYDEIIDLIALLIRTEESKSIVTE